MEEKNSTILSSGFQLPVKFTALNTTITGSSVTMQFYFEFYTQSLKHNATEIHALPCPQTRSPLLEQHGCSLDMPASVHEDMGAVAVHFSPFFDVCFFMQQCAAKIWNNPNSGFPAKVLIFLLLVLADHADGWGGGREEDINSLLPQREECSKVSK